METTKLTLRPTKTVADLAHQMAEEDNISITQLFSAFILTRRKLQTQREKIPIGPLTRSVTGILIVPEDWDYKKEMEESIDEKHGKRHENLP